jgi:hypothetical protein
MALTATASKVTATIRNIGRSAANPPIVFKDFGLNIDLTFAIWAKALNTIPETVLYMNGADGSYIRIGHDGVNWFMHVRRVDILFSTWELAPVTVGQWVVINHRRNGAITRFSIGMEAATPDPDNPVQFGADYNTYLDVNTAFTNFQIFSSLNLAVCNFKYWPSLVEGAELTAQMNKWEATGSPAPMWASPLRTPGDISNIVAPYTSTDWGAGHAFSAIDFPSNYTFHSPDPAYMAKHTLCPTWIYPIVANNIFPVVTVDPGLTPLTPTNYPGTAFWLFEDRGSVPLDSPFTSITYYGFPFKTGAGPGPSDTFGAFIDHLAATINGSPNPIYRFAPNATGIQVPLTLNHSNIFQWRFGASFTWPVSTPQVISGQGNLSYIYIFVTYIGYPPGVGVIHVPPDITPPDPENPPDPTLPPPITMAGLYAIVKDSTSDKYNVGIEVKIPDPTIRTALIGE